MSLFDFFFPQQAAAYHLRTMAERHQEDQSLQLSQMVREKAYAEALKKRIDDLEKDLGFMVLMTSSLMSALDEKGVLTRDDVRKELEELDAIDGMRDNRIDIRILKEHMKGRGPQP